MPAPPATKVPVILMLPSWGVPGLSSCKTTQVGQGSSVLSSPMSAAQIQLLVASEYLRTCSLVQDSSRLTPLAPTSRPPPSLRLTAIAGLAPSVTSITTDGLAG